ncbi:hypothetical protein NSK_002600 [Nannochloropsis salina CCMP1776]|uniref:RxLR effector protein n=1 Tax=Nannochloropsis salina CCMP1776 TaxID=1027361 RepID=A0A4D9D4C6_9STRA|nr:hypothetical protein NSK_002600 [Nannochloropsis salina CCMP1776]|eukprot:TFJ86392.1 hypothetical protein NSK_002600 [Nannochloropsis salina CCMP1776]
MLSIARLLFFVACVMTLFTTSAAGSAHGHRELRGGFAGNVRRNNRAARAEMRSDAGGRRMETVEVMTTGVVHPHRVLRGGFAGNVRRNNRAARAEMRSDAGGRRI